MASREKLSFGLAIAILIVLGGCIAISPASQKEEISSASIPDVTQIAARAARELNWIVKQMDTASGFVYCEKIIQSAHGKDKPFYTLEVQAATSPTAGMVTLIVKATPPPGGNVNAGEMCSDQVQAFMKKFNELKK
jgi:hypothetical protein